MLGVAPSKSKVQPPRGVQLHTPRWRGSQNCSPLAHLKPPFPWMLQLRAGRLPLLSCLTLEQPFTCFPMPSAGQPDHGLQEGPESQAVWQPCLTGLCWQQPVLLGMELARVSLRLLLTALPHSVACSFLSACSLQVLG